MTNNIADISLSKAAKIAGLAFLFMIISGPFAFIVFSNFIVPGDAATTANNIMGNDLLFRLAIVSFLIVITCDAVVAWGLFVLLKPVNKSLSLLTSWFRLMHATIFAISLVFLFIVLQFLSGADFLAVFGTDQLYALVLPFCNAFNNGYLIGQAFFSIHLLILGYLVFKSGYMPKFIGVLLIIGGPLGYLIDSFTKLLFPNFVALAYPGLAVGTIAEISLCFWLLFKGIKIPEMKS